MWRGPASQTILPRIDVLVQGTNKHITSNNWVWPRERFSRYRKPPISVADTVYAGLVVHPILRMRYVRFLKLPKTDRDSKSIKALITVTSDLGEDFLAEDVSLTATIRSVDPDGDVYLRMGLEWTAGMRSLPVAFGIGTNTLDWPVRLHVGPRDSSCTDAFEEIHQSTGLPYLISAWSGSIYPSTRKYEADRVVLRRFTQLNNRTLCCWEETGESIARHIW